MREEKELSEKERKRKILFDAKAEKLISEGYIQENLIISVAKANILAIVIMLPFMIGMAMLWEISGKEVNLEFSVFELILIFLIMIGLFVIHELIHGLTWGIFSDNHWKDIEFGVIWKMLTPYCTCCGTLTKMHYIIGSLMPTLILGFGLGIVAVMIGNIAMLFLAEIMILGGGGDFIIVGKLLLFKKENRECLFYDHPTECGLVVFYK